MRLVDAAEKWARKLSKSSAHVKNIPWGHTETQLPDTVSAYRAHRLHCVGSDPVHPKTASHSASQS